MADSQRIEDLRRRVEKDPASIAFAQLAEEYRRAGQLQESVAVCHAGLAIHPGYLSARVTLGRAFLELNQLDEAQAELSQVLKSAPENLAAIRGLAEIHHRRGDLAEALEQYRAALSLARNDPDLEQTVSDLTRRLAPKGPPRGSDGLSFEQMQRELLIIPQAQPPAAPVLQEPAPAPEERLDLVASVEPVELIESVEPLDLVVPEEPLNFVEVAEPLGLVASEEPLDVVAPVEPLELVASVEPLELIESVELLDLVVPEEPFLVTPVEPLGLVATDPVVPDEFLEFVESEEPLSAVVAEEPLEFVAPVEPLELVESVEPLELVAPVEPWELVSPVEPLGTVVAEEPLGEDPVRSRALLTIAALDQWLDAIHAAGFERHP